MFSQSSRSRWVLAAALALLATACGPSELPAFANPPPYDAGTLPDADTDHDAGPSR